MYGDTHLNSLVIVGNVQMIRFHESLSYIAYRDLSVMPPPLLPLRVAKDWLFAA
jgi:hypothetical protein